MRCALRVFLAVAVAGVFPAGAGAADLWESTMSPASLGLVVPAADGTCAWDGELPDMTTAPYGAVGLLSNGCTATLIDSSHLLTAAHCIVREGDAANPLWGNWFYPNFRRGDVDPPRFRVARAVMGAHDGTGDRYWPSDWAIATLLTPATGFPTIPISGVASTSTPVTVAHYSRDALLHDPACAEPPYADELGCVRDWPQWFVNSWWQNGLVSQGTVTTDAALGYSVTTAPGLGGSSGSPHLVQPVRGIYRINGVTHGGAGCPGVDGPWAGRFAEAPWFAANVAVASATASVARSGVFVIDRERNRLVFRERSGTGPLSAFGYYRYARSLPAGTHGRIAAFKLGGTGKPGVVVLGDDGGILKETDFASGWSGWKSISKPGGLAALDVDASYDKAGVNALFALTSHGGGGRIWSRRRVSGAAGAAWQPLWNLVAFEPGRSYRRLTAVRHHGDRLNQAWALTSQGAIRTAREEGSWSWSAVEAVPGPPLAPGELLVDIDAAWHSQNRAMLVALSSRGRAWYRVAASALSGSSWSAWKALPSQVDPGVAINRGGIRLVTITASRWAEGWPTTIVPVVFATDSWGNVYQTTWVGSKSAWSKWMPFSGKRIHSWQTGLD